MPTGNLPQTGTTADDVTANAAGLLGLSAALAAAGLTLVLHSNRKKEQEEN